MRILFVTEELPYPIHKNGAALINQRLLKLAPSGVRIDLVCMDNTCSGEDILSLKKIVSALDEVVIVKNNETQKTKLLNLISIFFIGRSLFNCIELEKIIKKQIKESRYDLIYLSPLTMISRLQRLNISVPIFLNAIDSYSNLSKSQFNRKKSIAVFFKMLFYKTYEKKYLKKAQAVNFVSSLDADHVLSFLNHNKVLNISLGVDREMFFERKDVAKEPCSLLFSGDFGYGPNLDALKYIQKELFPEIKKRIHGVKFYAVGKNPLDVKTENDFIIAGFVDDICEWYNRVDVFVCPLHYGAGVKNKILEAMSCALPIVCSSIAISGIDGLENGKHVIIADNLEEQAEAVVDLLKNDTKRKILGENSKQFVLNNYSWNKRIQNYYESFHMLIS